MIPGKYLISDFPKVFFWRAKSHRNPRAEDVLQCHNCHLELCWPFPWPLSTPHRVDLMFLISWLVRQILHGPCPTFPGLFRLHPLFNTTSQLASLMWFCVKQWDRKHKLASVSLPFVWRREELSQFVDLWEGRPKAALAKPSKAPSGSPGPCVTLLTKITFSPGPLFSSFFSPFPCPLYTHSLFPLQQT